MNAKGRKPGATKVVSVRLPADVVARLESDALKTQSTVSKLVIDAALKRAGQASLPCTAVMAHVLQTLARLEERGNADPELLKGLEHAVAQLTHSVLAETR